MPITADKVRELCARRESENLDFKAEMYDWTNDGNLELSKDLMAMANCLPSGSGSAYILIGVRESQDGTGEIIGVPPSAHLNDAAMHQKVADLNRRPEFTYGPVDVDGQSVGVFEIRPGWRPYYALRDRGSQRDGGGRRLQRFAPMYRSGSATDVATPDMVVAWARADDPVNHELRARELAKLQAESRPVPKFMQMSSDGSGHGFSAQVVLGNAGVSLFTVRSAHVDVQWNDRFRDAVDKTPSGKIPDGYVPPTLDVRLSPNETLSPGATIPLGLKFGREEALVHFRDAGIVVAGFEGRWADYRLRLVLANIYGELFPAEWTVKL